MRLLAKVISHLTQKSITPVTAPYFLILVGVWIIVIAVGADLIGIGGNSGIGTQQVILAWLGLAILSSGVVLDLTVGQRCISRWSKLFILNKQNVGRILSIVALLGLLVLIINNINIRIEPRTPYHIAIIAFFGFFIHRLFTMGFGGNSEGGAGGRGISRRSVEHTTFLRTTSVTAALIFLLYLMSIHTLYSHFSLNVRQVFHNLLWPKLNKRDAVLLERGYYETLLSVDWFTGELMQKYRKPSHWPPSIQETEVGRDTGDFLRIALVPSSETLLNGQPFHTNRWGMRDRDYEKKKSPLTYRVALLGSSLAMGLDVSDEETFEWALENRLNHENQNGRYDRYEILNFAVAKYTVLHQLVILENKVFSFEPDDVFYVAHMDKDWVINHLAGIIHVGIDIPYDYLRETVRKAGIVDRTTRLDAERALKPFSGEIVYWAYRRIVEQCRNRGVIPVWIFVPLVGEGGREEEITELVHLAEKAGFVVINLSDVYENNVPEAIWVAEWDHHPNAKGHKLIADRLYAELLKREERLSLDLLSPNRIKFVVEEGSQMGNVRRYTGYGTDK